MKLKKIRRLSRYFYGLILIFNTSLILFSSFPWIPILSSNIILLMWIYVEIKHNKFIERWGNIYEY